MRRMPLRSRLAIMCAVAVAIAIGAVSLISYIAVRNRLHDQMDKSIAATPVPRGDQVFRDNHQHEIQLGSACDHLGPPPAAPNEYYAAPLVRITYYSPSGSCTPPGSTQVVPQNSDLQIAGAPPNASMWRDGVTTAGDKVRVEVVPAQDNPSGVFLKSQPYQPIDDSLSSLAWLLTVVSLLGVGGAATVGLLVARAALRPVDVLTSAVEHVARTEDLSIRMPVSGDDEIARLSQSFNAMTAALQSSRDEQKRLVDDAGHELRTPLTSLRTTIDLLIRSEESGRALPEGKRSELLTGARTQMRELTVLIADLLELSRPEQASQVTAPVAFHEVAERAIERVRPRGAAREIPVTISEHLRPWTTHGAGAALERVRPAERDLHRRRRRGWLS